MSIIARYATREILKYFLIVIAGVVSIYLIANFFEKIDKLIEAELGLGKILFYFLASIPLDQLLPVCVLLAVLIAFSLMGKNREILALKSSGVSVYFLVKPALALGVFFSIVLLLLAEVVMPLLKGKANLLWLQQVEGQSAVVVRKKDIWIKSDHSIIHILHYQPEKRAIFGITLNRFDEDFRMVKRIDARAGYFGDSKWRLQDALVQERARDMEEFRIQYFEDLELDLGIVPQDLESVAKTSEEMNLLELGDYIRKIESEGYDATSYAVDYQAKLAFPFVCIIMTLFATGLTLRTRIYESVPMSIVYGLVSAFLYWVVYSFCLSLGKSGMLPPFVAAWITNLIFVSTGAYALLEAE